MQHEGPLTGHANHVVCVLQDLHNLELVLGEDLGKAVALLAHLSDVLVALEGSGVAVLGLREGAAMKARCQEKNKSLSDMGLADNYMSETVTCD